MFSRRVSLDDSWSCKTTDSKLVTGFVSMVKMMGIVKSNTCFLEGGNVILSPGSEGSLRICILFFSKQISVTNLM